MPTVEFKVSGVTNYWLKLDDVELDFGVDHKTTETLDENKDYYLGWWVLGNPGTEFKIELTPSKGYKIRSVATIPIERKIPMVGKTARAIKLSVVRDGLTHQAVA